MDGFRDRDRMNRGSSDRYDRYERYQRGGGRGGFAGSGGYQGGGSDVNIDEIAGIIEDSNAKQLDIIHDFFADAKDARSESEKQVISAINELSKDLTEKLEESKAAAEEAAKAATPEPAPVSEPVSNSGNENKEEIINTITDKISERGRVSDEILEKVISNNDLLSALTDEQMPMLIRGNTATLNQITRTLEENDDLLRQILDITNNVSNEITLSNSNSSPAQSTANMPSYMASSPVFNGTGAPAGGNDNSEEILNTVTNNSALLNGLRSDVASVQQQIRDLESGLDSVGGQPMPQQSQSDEAPLDHEDLLTKSQADELYKQVEEQIHSECVKVYRNLQKTLEDQNKAVIDGVGKGTGTIRIFALLAFIFSLFNLIISVLNILGILSF